MKRVFVLALVLMAGFLCLSKRAEAVAYQCQKCGCTCVKSTERCVQDVMCENNSFSCVASAGTCVKQTVTPLPEETPTDIKSTEPLSCSWCGGVCQDSRIKRMCTDVLPPANKDCKAVGETCQEVPKCGWCGANCLPYDSERMCTQQLPPGGKMCGYDEEKKSCVVIDVCKSINGIVKVTPEGGEGVCHDIQKAVDAAGAGDTIAIMDGNYNLEDRSAEMALLVEKPLIFAGQSKNTVLNLSSNNDIGILLKNSTAYASRESLQTKAVHFRNLKIVSNNSVMGIKSVDRLVWLENVVMSSTKFESDRVLFGFEQNAVYGYPATNIQIMDSEVDPQSSFYAVKMTNKDRSFGLYVKNSKVGRIAVQGPTGGTIGSADSLMMVDIRDSEIKTGEFNKVEATVKKNVFGPTSGGISALSFNDSQLDVENNTLVGADYGFSIGTFGSARAWTVKNNLIVNNRRVGVYIVDRPNPTGSMVFNNNLVWGNTPNYGYADGNPPLISDQTGKNGNISIDPKLGEGYCLQTGSPAIGAGEGGVNIGAKGLCSGVTPAPTCVPRPVCLDDDPPSCAIRPAPGTTYCACLKCQSGVIPKSQGNAFIGTSCDNNVNIVDFVQWRTDYVLSSGGQTTPREGWGADFNCDGIVNIVDFVIWRQGYTKYLNATPTPVQPTNTPAPACTATGDACNGDSDCCSTYCRNNFCVAGLPTNTPAPTATNTPIPTATPTHAPYLNCGQQCNFDWQCYSNACRALSISPEPNVMGISTSKLLAVNTTGPVLRKYCYCDELQLTGTPRPINTATPTNTPVPTNTPIPTVTPTLRVLLGCGELCNLPSDCESGVCDTRILGVNSNGSIASVPSPKRCQCIEPNL